MCMNVLSVFGRATGMCLLLLEVRGWQQVMQKGKSQVVVTWHGCQTPVYSCTKILIFFPAPTHCGLQFTLICEFRTHEVNVLSCLSCVCAPWSWSYRQLSGTPCWCCELNLGLLEEQYTVLTAEPPLQHSRAYTLSTRTYLSQFLIRHFFLFLFFWLPAWNHSTPSQFIIFKWCFLHKQCHHYLLSWEYSLIEVGINSWNSNC